MKWVSLLWVAIIAGMFSFGDLFALTPEQVVALKKAGISEKTIQLMIAQEREAKENPYDTMGTKEITDAAGNSVVIYSTGKADRSWERAEKEKVDKAWQMLQYLIIDGRKQQ